MSQEEKIKPSIVIELEPYLQDFLFHEFGQTRNHDGIVVSGTHDIGRMIQALVTVSDKPRKQPLGENPVTLYLPIQSWNHALFEENFIYIPEWKQHQLRLYIEASFRIKVASISWPVIRKDIGRIILSVLFLKHTTSSIMHSVMTS